MDIDQATAAALGFPKLKYAWVERERRWLCRGVPAAPALSVEVITDLYVTGVRLRLREARPLDGGPVMRRLTRKADVDAATRLLTSVYLSEAEFALFTGLPGARIRKTRHRLQPPAGGPASATMSSMGRWRVSSSQRPSSIPPRRWPPSRRPTSPCAR